GVHVRVAGPGRAGPLPGRSGRASGRAERRARRLPPPRRHGTPGPQRTTDVRQRGRGPPGGAMQQPVRRDAVHLHIDWTACEGRGRGTELLPELLGRDEWGYPVPVGGPDPAVPAELADVAGFAVTHCPKLALRLLDER